MLGGSAIFTPGWLVVLWEDGQKDKALVKEFRFSLCVSYMLLNIVFFLHLLGVSKISFEIGKKYI